MTESLIGFGILLTLIMLRVPIAFAMAAVGGIGFALLRGVQPALSMTGTVAFDTALSYSPVSYTHLTLPTKRIV